MKVKFNTRITVNIVLVIIALLSTCPFWLRFVHLPASVVRHLPYTYFYSHFDDLKPIDEEISSDLPHFKYVKLKDSIRQTRDLIDGNMPTAGGSQFAYIAGTGGSYKLCDTCTVKNYWKDLKEFPNGDHTQYYIKLPAWKLKVTNSLVFINDSVKYYVDHGQAYVRKIVVDSITKYKNGEDNYKTHLINIPVKFRYPRWDQCIAIPVSANTKSIIDMVLVVCGILFAVYFLVLIGVFLKFILDLSKGLAFTNENLFRLKIISISLLAYPVAGMIFILLTRLFLHDYFIPDIVLSDDALNTTWKTLAFGIVFLLFYRAFRQGKLLKDEQDLTV